VGLGRRVRIWWYEHTIGWDTLVHVLVGVLAGALNAYNPLVSLQLVLIFLIYQFIQVFIKPDMDWEDVAEFAVGWLVGLGLTCFI